MKDDLRVAFGLEQQGHITTIEAELKRWNDNNEFGNDMTYCKDVWDGIGKKIGWDSMTAALHYFKYLNNPNSLKPLSELTEEDAFKIAESALSHEGVKYENFYDFKMINDRFDIIISDYIFSISINGLMEYYLYYNGISMPFNAVAAVDKARELGYDI